MANQVLVFEFVNMHGTLALYVEFPLVACVGGISTITFHASYLITNHASNNLNHLI